MTRTIEAKKAALVRKATAFVDELPDPAEQNIARHVIAEFYEHVPPADVAERSPRNLYGAALSLLRFAERRRAGRAKIRVHNPDPDTDGWSSPHTIVEIVNDDMPFLVDSVTGAINAGNRAVHLIIHPIFTVARAADGRLGEIRAAGNGRAARIMDANRDHPRSRIRPALRRLTRRLWPPSSTTFAQRSGLAADAPGAP